MDTNQLWQFYVSHQSVPEVVNDWRQTVVLIVGMLIGAIPIYFQNSRIHKAVNSGYTALVNKYDALNAAYLSISKTVSTLQEKDRNQQIKDASLPATPTKS